VGVGVGVDDFVPEEVTEEVEDADGTVPEIDTLLI